jgi:hypothetical protein
MYYSYSVSLMHFLLHKKSKPLASFIFNQLELSEAHQAQLRTLLDTPALLKFTDLQRTTVIEPILGPAVRRFAANKTRERFMADLKENSIVTAAVYGMAYQLKLLFAAQGSAELATLLEDNDFTNETFTAAEIFRVFPVKSQAQPWEFNYHQDFPPLDNEDEDIPFFYDEHAAPQPTSPLQLFALGSCKALIEKYTNGWVKRAAFIEQESLKIRKHQIDKIKARSDKSAAEIDALLAKVRPALTLDEINKSDFHKAIFLNELIRDLTIEFFTANGYANLKTYITHLNTQGIWGTEETLLLLNTALQGEQEVRGADGKVSFVPKATLALQIFRNGRPAVDPDQDFVPDLVLDNEHQTFWVSRLPPISPAKENEYTFDAPKKPDAEETPKNKPESEADKPQPQSAPVIAAQKPEEQENGFIPPLPMPPNEPVKANVVVPPSSGAEDEPAVLAAIKQKKIVALEQCGFTAKLKELEDKIKELQDKGYPAAADEAQYIYNSLVGKKEEFVDEQSSLTPRQFSKQCIQLINTAPQTELINHRGVGKVITALLNALFAVCTIGIPQLIYGRFTLFNPLPTDSYNKIHAFKESAHTLKV